MAKYDTRRRGTTAPRRNSRGFFRQMGLLCVSFMCGYLTASFYDYTHLSAWVGTHLLATQPVVVAGKLTAQEASLPKPKFEFYTLLTQDSHGGVTVLSEPAANTTPANATPSAPVIASIAPSQPPPPPMDLTVTPSAVRERAVLPVPLTAQSLARSAVSSSSVAANKDMYWMQVASFRKQQDAERMKASLIIKGFEAHVSAVTQQHTNWYRVVMGPFASKIDAQHAQGILARRERITGMIRRMDT